MDIINYALSKKKVTMPVDAGGTAQNGISGQILQSNGDGTTQWVSAFPFEVEILETICENVELTPDNNIYTLPDEITLDYLDLYYIDYKVFSNGVIIDKDSGVYFSRVAERDDESLYISWLSDNITLESTRITDKLVYDSYSSILSIYKVSLNVSDGVLDAARKLEGYGTIASGWDSHAEGNETTASGESSHAEGYGTIASGWSSHAQGRYNIEDTEEKYANIVGNGTSDSARSNAHTLTWGGVPWYQGRPQFGGTAMDNGSQTVMANGDKEIILASSTPGSTKKFKITVDDSGTISTTEVI